MPPIPAVVRRLVRVRSEEAVPLGLLALTMVLFQAGIAVSVGAASALFLSGPGSAALPGLFVLLGALMLPMTWLVSKAMERLGGGRMTLVLGAAAGLAGLLAAIADPTEEQHALAWAIFLVSQLLWVYLSTTLWDWFDDRFHLLDAKRLFPLLQAAGSLGALAAGLAVSQTEAIEGFDLKHLFVAWSVVSLMATAAAALAQSLEPEPTVAFEDDGDNPATTEGGSSGWGPVYVALLVAGLAVSVVLATVLEIQIYTVLEQGRDEAALVVLFGWLTVAAALTELLVGPFGFPFLVQLLGVRNLALFFPTAVFAAFGAFIYSSQPLGGVDLTVQELTFGAAIFGWFVLRGLQPAIDDNLWNLLFNAIPDRYRSQVRVWAEGAVDPAAAGLAGLWLYTWGEGWTALELAVAGVGGSVSSIALMLGVRAAYGQVVVDTLRGSWLDLDTVRPPPLQPDQLEELRAHALVCSGADLAWTLQTLWLEDRDLAATALLEALERLGHGEQAVLLAPLTTMLDADDPTVLRTLLSWLATHAEGLDAVIIEALGRRGLLPSELLHTLGVDPDGERRTAALASLRHSGDLRASAAAASRLFAALHAGPSEQGSALSALAGARDAAWASRVAFLAESPEAQVRHAALRTLARLSGPDTRRFGGRLLEGLANRSEHDAVAAVQGLRATRDTRLVLPALRRASHLSAGARRGLSSALQDLGLVAVPPCTTALLDHHMGLEGRALAARVLAELAPCELERHLEAAVGPTVTEAYRCLSRATILSELDEPAAQVLRRYYLEGRRRSLDFVVRGLALAGTLPDPQRISAALHGKRDEDRAQAVEALEQAGYRELFRRLLPLVDGSSLAVQREFAHETWGIDEVDAEQVVRSSWETGGSLARACSAELRTCRVLAEWGAGSREALAVDAELRAALAGQPSTLLRLTLLSAMARLHGRPGPASPVAVLHQLAQLQPLKAVGPFTLLPVMEGLGRLELDAGEHLCRVGQPVRHIHLVQEGDLESLPAGGTPQPLGTGASLGDGAIYRESDWPADVVARSPAVVVRLPLAWLRRCALADPELATGLLAQEARP